MIKRVSLALALILAFLIPLGVSGIAPAVAQHGACTAYLDTRWNYLMTTKPGGGQEGEFKVKAYLNYRLCPLHDGGVYAQVTQYRYVITHLRGTCGNSHYFLVDPDPIGSTNQWNPERRRTPCFENGVSVKLNWWAPEYPNDPLVGANTASHNRCVTLDVRSQDSDFGYVVVYPGNPQTCTWGV